MTSTSHTTAQPARPVASPETSGVHHVGLTVPELDEARSFFCDLLGFELVAERPESNAVFVSDGHQLITLWQSTAGRNARAFDRHHNIGLHHIAWKVAADRLDEVFERLAESSLTKVEFAPEQLGNGPARHCMLSGPGGVRLEFVAVPGATP